MFVYCLNNPTNALDPMGEDAIWLQDSDAVFGAGHTGLLIQDSCGRWWHFYWGNNRSGKKGKSGEGNILLLYSGNINLSAINSFYEKHYGGKYERLIYFSGNFANSVTYAKALAKNYYNLLLNNCMQVSTDVLRKGTFAKSNSAYQIFLSRVRSATVPNLACGRMSAFHLIVETWHQTPWYMRCLIMSPMEAAWLL